MAVRGFTLIFLIVVNFSPGNADECSPAPLHQYPACFPRYYNVTVSEATAKNSDVQQLNCTDPEGGRLTWRISSGNVKRYFKINQAGMLTTKKRIDAEGKVNPYLLLIDVEDSGNPILVSTVVLTIFITSVNDEKPQMVNLPSGVDVVENTPIGSIILGCTLMDADSARLPVGVARARIVSGNEDNLFRLDPRTCALTLNKRLDYEAITTRQLLFHAYELDVAAPLTTEQNVTINVVDYNDHPPVTCTDYIVLITLPEDAMPGTVVTSLNCTDIDVSDQLQYTLAPGSPNKLAVDENTGEVTVANQTDFETEDRNFDVFVHVHDVSSNPMTVTVVINVEITDVDDNVPLFESDVTHIEVPEDYDLGRVVWTVRATDDDSPSTPLSDINFRLVSATADYFSLHPRTGMVTIKQLLDREVHSNVLLTVSAHSSDRPTATSAAVLNVTIVDSNDNRPQFDQALYTGQVSEGAATGTSVCDVTAHDADAGANGDVTYSIDSAVFSIHPDTGVISLIGPLDYETRTSYLFVVKATDGAVPSTTSEVLTSEALVTIEVEGVNEWLPVWQTPGNDTEVRYVPENTMPGTSLFTVSASDDDNGEDGRVTYRLLQPAASPFMLHADQGVVTLRSTLDRESQDTYTLVLEARDSSATDPKSSTVSLTVSVTDHNDNAPVCVHPEPLLVPGSVAVGDTLLTLSCSDVDLTNGAMTFVKLSGDASGVFRLDPNTGEVKLFRAATQARYEVRVEVRDGGIPENSAFLSLAFIIEDSFVFANLPMVVEISEDTPVGSVVFDAETVGSNLPSFFELGSGSGAFAVQPSTGEIFLTSSLDREATGSYQVTVIAHTAAGHSTTSTATVSVMDVNDNAPVICGTFNMSVSEDLAVPYVLQVFSALDDDLEENGTVTFRITAGNDDGHFSLDADGQLSVVSPLDADSSQLYELAIVAEDGGSPSLTAEKYVLVAVLDVDEFQPEFVTAGQSLLLILPENTALGSLLVEVRAEDADIDDDVKFDLVSGNGDDTFVVDRDTGSLYLVRVLDREERSDYELVIQVSNYKQESKSSTISLTVDDVNDNPPTFSKQQYMYEVAYNTSAATSIGEVVASDRDLGTNGEIYLEITAGDIDDVFAFGGLSLMTNKTMDSSVASSYSLTVRATDKGSPLALSSEVTVLITVTPQNTPPKFFLPKANITVQENSLTGTAVYDFQATADGAREGESGNIVYSITSGNSGGWFHLDQFTGQLYVVRDLDYEQDHSHALSVLAEHSRDAALSDVMNLTVHVTNVNDNSPAFPSDYRWTVSEGSHAGSVVGTVQANDLDEGPFDEVSYSLSGDDRFTINGTTGEVVVTGQVNFNDNYIGLSLLATDQAGTASLTGKGAILIHVTDVNDHVPSFPEVEQEVNVSESVVSGFPVTVLLPQDGDHGDNGKLTCHIADGNQAAKFSMDPDLCLVTTLDLLDAESQSLFVLTLTATDGGSPALTGTMSLTVHVTAHNDHTPVFSPSTVHVQLARAVPPNTVVYTALATDDDTGNNGEVVYALLSGNTNGYFSLDPITGRIQTVTALDLAADNHTLLVIATDRGHPARNATLTIHVDVTPALVTLPAVSLTMTILENSASGTFAGTVPSDRSTTTLSHSITSGNYGAAFSVTTDSNGDGVIRVAGSVDRETYPEYQLVVETERAGGTDTTVVMIRVTDVNDHAPAFARSTYTFAVVENLSAGSTVANLQVRDDDEGANAAVTLSFAASTPVCDAFFNLHSDGAVTIKQPLDYEALRELRCEIVASDNGSPALTSTASFTATVVDIAEELVQIAGSSASVYLSLEIPFDSSSGRLIYTLSAEDFGMSYNPGDTLDFLSLSDDGVFAVSSTTGEVTVGRPDLLYDSSRYFQWVVCHHEGSSTDTQLGMLRVDTFNMNQHVVAISYAATKEHLESQRSEVRARLQLFFDSGTRAEVLEIRDQSAANARRRLLDLQSVVLMYVVGDTSADGVGGVDQAKIFLTQADLLQALQQSSDGTPVSGLSDSVLPVLLVMPYKNDLDPQDQALLDTQEGLSLIVALVVLCVVVVAILFFCFLWKLHNKKKRKQLGSQSLFRSDSMSEMQGKSTKMSTGEDFSESTAPDSEGPPVVTDRRASVEIKRELDSMLPLPLLLTSRVYIQTPPSSTRINAFQEKQAALNRLIEERKNRKNRKKKEENDVSLDTGVMLLPSEGLLIPEEFPASEELLPASSSSSAAAAVAAEAEASPCVDLREPADIESDRRQDSEVCRSPPAVGGKNTEHVLFPTSGSIAVTAGSTAEEFSTPARSSPNMEKARLLHNGTPPSSVSSDQSPPVTARSQHVQPGDAWMTSSDTARDAAAQDYNDADEDGIPVEKLDTPPRTVKWAKTSDKRSSIFANFASVFGWKKNTKANRIAKRASMPVAITDSQKEHVAAVVAGQKTKDEGTARLRLSMPNDRDVSELKLEAGLMQSRVERPDQIPTVRRQSFFV